MVLVVVVCCVCLPACRVCWRRAGRQPRANACRCARRAIADSLSRFQTNHHTRARAYVRVREVVWVCCCCCGSAWPRAPVFEQWRRRGGLQWSVSLVGTTTVGRGGEITEELANLSSRFFCSRRRHGHMRMQGGWSERKDRITGIYWGMIHEAHEEGPTKLKGHWASCLQCPHGPTCRGTTFLFIFMVYSYLLNTVFFWQNFINYHNYHSSLNFFLWSRSLVFRRSMKSSQRNTSSFAVHLLFQMCVIGISGCRWAKRRERTFFDIFFVLLQLYTHWSWLLVREVFGMMQCNSDH